MLPQVPIEIVMQNSDSTSWATVHTLAVYSDYTCNWWVFLRKIAYVSLQYSIALVAPSLFAMVMTAMLSSTRSLSYIFSLMI